MKYLGKITDNKDLVTKEYVDNAVAGAGGGTVSGVKGNSESTYRTGNVNLTAANIGAVPTTRTVNSKALSSDISLSASDVGAVPTSRTINSKALSSNITLSASDVSAVPTTRTVNSKALSSNITLSASDVSAVPTSRTVNSKALSSNITLSASDVGAVPSSFSFTSSGLAGWDSRCTVASGGYYNIGNWVIVQMKLTIKTSLGANDYWTILSGLPSAQFDSALAVTGVGLVGGVFSGYVSTEGRLLIATGSKALANNNVIAVGGVYRKS